MLRCLNLPVQLMDVFGRGGISTKTVRDPRRACQNVTSSVSHLFRLCRKSSRCVLRTQYVAHLSASYGHMARTSISANFSSARSYTATTNNRMSAQTGDRRAPGGRGAPLMAETVGCPPSPEQLQRSSRSLTNPVDTLCHTLRSFTSPETSPQSHSPSYIFSLYSDVKTRSHLSELKNDHFSELATLFGYLSLKDRELVPKFATPRDPHYSPAFTPHWGWVVEILQDKVLAGHQLSDADHYWLIQAQLSGIAILDENDTHYDKIQHRIANPNIHIQYFSAMLDLPSDGGTARVVERLCSILELTRYPHPRLIMFFWDFVFRLGNTLPLHLKSRILSMVSLRLSFKNAVHSLPYGAHTQSELKPHIHSLVDLLTSAIFPLPTAHEVKSIAPWAFRQTISIFEPSLTHGVRWDSFMLLATYYCRGSRHPTDLPLAASEFPRRDLLEHVAEWRTIVTLAIASRDVASRSATSSSSAVLLSLWKSWTHLRLFRRPHIVSRIVLSEFLRLSVRFNDTTLRTSSTSFLTANTDFHFTQGNSAPDRFQLALMTSYAIACLSRGHEDVCHIFTTLSSLTSETNWRSTIASRLIGYYVHRNSQIAYEVHSFCNREQIPLPEKAVLSLGGMFSTKNTFLHTVSALRNSDLSRPRQENMTYTALEVLRKGRKEVLERSTAAVLGQGIINLYQGSLPPPPPHLKFPIRFFLPILIRSGRPELALEIFRIVYHKKPLFFTSRSIHRILKALLRHRYLKGAAQLVSLINTPSRNHSRQPRSLVLGLFRAGASRLAKSNSSTAITNITLGVQGRLMQRVRFQCRRIPRRASLGILGILGQNPKHTANIKFAISLLVQARRLLAAKQLFVRKHALMTPAEKTEIGNIILQGPIYRFDQRNARLVRQLLRTRSLLAQEYQFVPDRVTINIILKAFLLWRTGITSSQVKALFDDVIKAGYPAEPRWRQKANGLPFGSQLTSGFDNLGLDSVTQAISFHRHVRPMYKMFVRAFYQLKDPLAARVVVGILKEQEIIAMREREKRERARRVGILKKRARLMREAVTESESK